MLNYIFIRIHIIKTDNARILVIGAGVNGCACATELYKAGIALLVMKYKLNVRELAKSTEDLKLMVDATRESYSVIKALGYRIFLKETNIVYIIPRFIIVGILRILLKTKLLEIGGVYHVSQAPDEMNFLAGELKVLVEKSGLPVPALRKVLSLNY